MFDYFIGSYPGCVIDIYWISRIGLPEAKFVRKIFFISKILTKILTSLKTM